MKNKYIDLIQQTFDFPQPGFEVIDNELYFHDIPLMDIIKQYGTPLKITYLPKIREQIEKMQMYFKIAFAKTNYDANYTYCYCTKSSHFSFVLEEVIKSGAQLETSSAYDINIIETLEENGVIDKNTRIVCNGFKREQYIEKIAEIINNGYKNTIPVLDNKKEFELLDELINVENCEIGIRIATEEEPDFNFYTSRLGIRYNDIIPFCVEKIIPNKKYKLKMLHFFINKGIKDNIYYWNELHKCVNLYCELKKHCPDLDSLNLGGGFPSKNSLAFEYDYEYMVEEIVGQIKDICTQNNTKEPHIYTEFGSYTVGSSGAVLYSILDQKLQNDRERWNMIDGSFMNTLPDVWALNQRFILLAINNWDKEVERINLGGLTCDSMDYYNDESHLNAIFLPRYANDEKLYIGFFYTGAYQDALGGIGGVQHCLIPGPKHVLIDKEGDEITTRLFAKEQSYKSMLKTLGY